MIQEVTQEMIVKSDKIRLEIQELEEFLDTVVRFDKERFAQKSRCVSLLFVRKVYVKTYFLGKRIFGPCVSDYKSSSIIVPNLIRNDIREIVRSKLSNLHKELNAIFGMS